MHHKRFSILSFSYHMLSSVVIFFYFRVVVIHFEHHNILFIIYKYLSVFLKSLLQMLSLWSSSILLRVIKYFNAGISIAHLPMRPNKNWEIIFSRNFSPLQRNNVVTIAPTTMDTMQPTTNPYCTSKNAPFHHNSFNQFLI